MEVLADYPGLLALGAAAAGLLVGSFLNVVIHRLPRMIEQEWTEQCAELAAGEPPPPRHYNLAFPPSHCPHCDHRIGALENIPVLSYLILGGRCKSCRARISPRYPLVELLAGAGAAGAAFTFGHGWMTLGAALFIWALIALTFIDLDTQLLPDDITLPLVWLGLLFNLFGVFTSLENAVIGAMAGYLSLWTVYWLFKLIRGKEGMGYGDFKLLAAIGAWLGWQVLPVVIFFSSLVGAVTAVTLLALRGGDHNRPIPFGPYLAAAGALALFWGAPLMKWYLG
ncbi:leader peptidase (prepilin peptidase) / N-methyltransferase [Burkholderiales bacterium]|nr:MAG: prepilin peptidase [Burkholderiales bacterium]CAG1007766.1 leader peptidase (prepilin peptidase) / N-methyltransferase [Burkholderiales bacterium]